MKSTYIRHARILAVIAIALPLGIFQARPAAAATATGVQTIQGFYGTLLDTMRNGSVLGQQGRYARLEPVIRRDFNVTYMTQLAVGPSWTSLSEPERQQVTQAFEHYLAAVYADRFDSYAGEQLQVLGEQQSPYGIIVQTRIVKSTGEPVSINYLMVNSGGHWQVGDVYLDGSISELATRRSEFSSILRNQGVEGLIAALNSKASMLVPARS